MGRQCGRQGLSQRNRWDRGPFTLNMALGGSREYVVTSVLVGSTKQWKTRKQSTAVPSSLSFDRLSKARRQGSPEEGPYEQS